MKDREIRDKFLTVFERNLPVNPFARLTYILREKDWEPFRDYFWLRHALWLLLRCIPCSDSLATGNRRIFIDSSATLWRTLFAVTGLRLLASDSKSSRDGVVEQSLQSDLEANTRSDEVAMETDQDNYAVGESGHCSRLDVLVEDQKSLLIEAASFDFSTAVDCIIGLLFSVQDDVSFVGDMFSQLFNSLWISMTDEERSFIGGLAVPFMTSGVHVQQAHAVHPVINIFLETFARCNPPIHIDPRATEDVLDYLASLYSEMVELDQYAAVWNRRALTVDSIKVLAMQQLGDIEEALEFGQSAAISMLRRMENQFGKNPIGEVAIKEYEFLDAAYIQCTKELCRWRVLCDIARNPHVENPELLYEAAVHLPDWYLARQCRDQILACTRPEFVIQSITFGAMLGVLGDPADGPVVSAKKLVDDVTQALVVGWRILPPIQTYAHVKLLQAMTMVREVGDVLDLRRALDIVLPPGINPQSILPIHSAATGQLLLAKAARDRGMESIAIRSLNKLHTLITLPMMDCHQKLIDHLKTLRKMAKKYKTSTQQKMDLLQEALLITGAARIEDFSREQCCRLFYQKGSILSQLERNDEAMHAFSAAAALIDPPNSSPMNTACSMFKAWGHHLDNLHEASAMSRGSPAINCYFEAARIENETRARKYIARILWTAKHVVACGIFSAVGLDQVLKDRARSIVPFNWLPWLPQLITELQERPTSGFVHIVDKIASAYPLFIVSVLRPVLDSAVIENVIESVAKNELVQLPPDGHKNSALCRILEKACRRRLADVRFMEELRTEILEMLDGPPPMGSALLKLVENVIKWQTKLQNRLYSLPRRYPIRLASKFLADYSSAMACVEIPSSFNSNMTKQYQYVTLIARFYPHVEIVVKGGRVMKKLQITAVNGKVSAGAYLLWFYAFIVVFLDDEVFVPYVTTFLTLVHTLCLLPTGAYPMSFVAKKPNVFDTIRPLDVFGRYGMTFGMRPDDAITMFYDRLVASEGCPKTVMLETYR
uniref:FAT domain-containing protein n=1 Tax=Angiostrongylus cantonensis TaxID=6313 RepID=A0A158P7Z8_ANGCA